MLLSCLSCHSRGTYSPEFAQSHNINHSSENLKVIYIKCSMFYAISNYHLKTSRLKTVENLVKQTVQALRGPDCKYRESADSCKISQFILFYLKDPFGELFSKMEIKSSITLCFFRKIQKFKLRRGGPRPPGKTMKNSATSLTPYATTR